MALPKQPVTLSAEQIAELNRNLSKMRHDVNNCLSLVVAAVELGRLQPQSAERMINSLSAQPRHILDSIAKFTGEFEKTLGITRE
jgi:cob(I)alamin adenosyltransferase